METTDLAEVRRTLWAAADELRANSTLAPNEYRGPVLGLIFLAYAERRFEQVRGEVEAKATARRPVTAVDYRAKSVLFIPDQARLSYLVDLPEEQDLGAAADAAMRLVETSNPELKDVLPKGYQRLEKSTLVELLRLFSPLPRKLSGDAFGLIYEDFLSNFAMAEGRLGGEFFTPRSIVRLFDFVMANPPFNVNGVDKDKLAGDHRFPYGLPRPDNANYLWIQLFASSLAEDGRGGFVMANSAGDAGHSEREIRRQLVASRVEDRRRDGGHRHQLLLHGHPAGDAVVPRQRQAGWPP